MNKIAIILAIVGLAVIAFWPVSPTNFGLCLSYALPEYLESRTDGQCAAIGMLLEKAADNPAGCVYVTNSWWPLRQKVVDRAYAAELAKGY